MMALRIGDLVSHTVNKPGFPKRVGIVTKCHIRTLAPDTVFAATVRFFDGKVPETNSYRPRDLRVISER